MCVKRVCLPEPWHAPGEGCHCCSQQHALWTPADSCPCPVFHPCVSSLQLLRRVGFQTTKSQAMFRPTDMTITRASPNAAPQQAAVATVADKHNLGWTIKYTLRFDDEVVSVVVEYSACTTNTTVLFTAEQTAC